MKARLATPADDALLTSIAMHPDIRRWTAHDGAPAFDPKVYTAHPKSFAVIVEDKLGPVGFFSAFAVERAAYTIHTNLLPTCRGRLAMEAATVALRFAFIETDAEMLWTMVPANNPQARFAASMAGFAHAYARESVWLSGGKKHAMEYMRMDVDGWIQRGSMAGLGQDFHAELIHAGGHVGHAHDGMHDSYVGAAWAMLEAGRIDKAVSVYGRWGRVAGYLPFEVVARDPLLVDIGTCFIAQGADQLDIRVKEHA